MFELKLPTHPKTADDLRCIRYWLRELSRVHFYNARTDSLFLNTTLVNALFPNEKDGCIFLSFGSLSITALYNAMISAEVAALTRVSTLHCHCYGNYLSSGIETLFSEFLLASKHRVNRASFTWIDITNLTTVIS